MFSQSNPSFRVAGANKIIIDKQVPLSDTYELKTNSQKQFVLSKSIVELAKKEFVEVVSDEQNNKLIIKLQLDQKPNWTVEDWYNYLMK